MLIKHLMEDDSSENYNEMISKIAQSEYFNEMYGKQLETIEPEDLEDETLVTQFHNLYRGFKSEEPIVSIKPYGDRIPLDTNSQIHKFINMLSKDKFAVSIRNLIFADKSHILAKEYGDVYVLFPLGDYRLFYSKGVKDFTARYSTDYNVISKITDELLLNFEYDESAIEAVAEEFEDYEFDFESQKKFDKSLKKLARKMSSQYFYDPDGTYNIKPGMVKMLERNIYETAKNIFKHFSKYVQDVQVTYSIGEIDNEEIMVNSDEIIAVRMDHFNEMLAKIMEIKKGP